MFKNLSLIRKLPSPSESDMGSARLRSFADNHTEFIPDTYSSEPERQILTLSNWLFKGRGLIGFFRMVFAIFVMLVIIAPLAIPYFLIFNPD